VLLLGDIGVYGFREVLATHSSRVYNIGLLEQSTVSVAAGLALSGMIPIVYTIAPFMVERALEQIKVDLCYQDLGANLISIGGSYDYSKLGPTHHCPADVPILNQIPGIEIIVPGHPDELDSLFNEIYNNSSPTYVRLSDYSNDKSYDVKIGKNLVIKKGGQLVIIAVGPILQLILNAVNDIDVTVIYCTTIKPFDLTVLDNFADHKVLIVEPYYSGAIANSIMRGMGSMGRNVECVGVQNEFIDKYGTRKEIDNFIGLTVENIKKRVVRMINE
jgi:transketolase